MGSILSLTDNNGTSVFKATYDVWGRQTVSQNTIGFARGYTGHEHLPEFGVIDMNGRMYDPLQGRFLSPDPYVQMPDYSQNFNRYAYCLNNPLVYTDPSGEFIFTLLATIIPGAQPLLPFAIAADISWMSDYGMQVAMNHMSGQRGADAWFKNIDWFDVGTSAVVGGLTGGYSAEYKAGKTLGKFGTWVYKNRKLITLGEMVATSAVDITGEGFQKVDMSDFSTRMAINLTTFGLTELASNGTKGLVKNQNPGYNDVTDNLPIQEHHFATNKNKAYTPRMEEIARGYGLDLDGDWNKEAMNHLGRHPNVYHEFVLEGMKRAALEAGGDQARFIQLFDQYVKQIIISNPLLLRKAGW